MTAYPSPALGEQGDRTLEEQWTECGAIVIRNDMLIVKLTTHKGTKRSQSRVCVYWLIMVWLVDKESCMSRFWLHICRGFLVNKCLEEGSWGKGYDSMEDRLLGDIHTCSWPSKRSESMWALVSGRVLSWHLASCVSHNTQYMHIHTWVSDLERLTKP